MLGDDHLCPILELKRKRKPVIVEHVHYNAHDNLRFVEVYGYPIFDKSGNLIQMIEYSMDITERKLVEKELIKFSRAVEQSLTIICITDPDFIIEYINPKFLQITGYSYDDAIGRNAFTLSELTGEEKRTIWENLLLKEEWQGEFYNRKKSGEYYWEFASITAIKDTEGKITNYLKVATDISRRKAGEIELNDAKTVAEKANRLKSQFLANMSHEIRTPMNSIMGFIGLLNGTRLDNKQKEFLSIITHSSHILLDIINDILEISKIESGMIEIDNVRFSPFDEFTLVSELFSARANEKNIELLVYIDPGLPGRVEGPLRRIKQVLMNLYSNAVKFTPNNGKVLIDISLLHINNDRCKIHFSVSDNGIGIHEDKREIIFEPFMQADNSITRNYGGTGLGLSISKNLVKMMGGEINLISKVDKGSYFFFEIEFQVIDKNRTANLEEIPESFKPVILELDNKYQFQCELLRRYFDSFKIYSILIHDHDNLNDLPHGNCLYVFADSLSDETLMKIFEEKKYADICVILKNTDQNTVLADNLLNNRIGCISLPINSSKILKSIKFVKTGDSGLFYEKSTEKVNNIHKYKGRILVVEDNKINQELIKILLENFGIEVHLADDGLEAVEKYKSGEYDLIFMDLHMPRMDGMDATREIRVIEKSRQGNKRDIPIIALTADVISSDSDNMESIGMTDYVSKPFTTEKLYSVLEFYLKIPGNDVDIDKNFQKDNIIMDDLDRTSIELKINKDILLSLIKRFLIKTDEYIVTTDSCINKSDFDKISKEAHKLKGSASNLRLKEVADIVNEIETNAKNKQFNACREELNKLINLLNILKKVYNII